MNSNIFYTILITTHVVKYTLQKSVRRKGTSQSTNYKRMQSLSVHMHTHKHPLNRRMSLLVYFLNGDRCSCKYCNIGSLIKNGFKYYRVV